MKLQVDKHVQRCTAIVRKKLMGLADIEHNGEGPHESTIQQAASDFRVGLDDLRRFRDGRDDAIPASVLVVWGRLIGSDGGISRGDVDGVSNWHSEVYGDEDNRIKRMDFYDIIEDTRTEAESALTSSAEMVVTGSAGGTMRSGAFAPQTTKQNEFLQNLLNRINRRILSTVLPDNQKVMLVRDMCKYGSWFEELVLENQGDGVHVSRLIPKNVREMRVLPKPTPEACYGRYPDGRTTPVETWPAWKIAHFANKKSRWDRYGRSIFQSCLRSWVQVEAMEGGIMTRRLERAAMRYKHMVDVSMANDRAGKMAIVEDAKNKHRKTKTIDSTPNMQHQRITPPTGQDFFVPVDGPNSVADVEAIQGDAHLNEIEDFLHFFNKWLAGLGPPKHHLGYEQGQMRSVGTDLHIAFARKARRVGLNFSQTLNHLYHLELLLAGYDPRTADYILMPPPMGTRDELMHAQVMQAYATAIASLADAFANTGEQPSVQWFLRQIMGMDENAIADLGTLVPVIQKTGTTKDGPSMTQKEQASMVLAVQSNAELSAEIYRAAALIDEVRASKMSARELAESGALTPGDMMPDFHQETFCKHLEIRQLASLAA